MKALERQAMSPHATAPAETPVSDAARACKQALREVSSLQIKIWAKNAG